jgi:hypothetical protein
VHQVLQIEMGKAIAGSEGRGLSQIVAHAFDANAAGGATPRDPERRGGQRKLDAYCAQMRAFS